MIDQKFNYIHHTPEVSGFVDEATHCSYSSEFDYSRGTGALDFDDVNNHL